VQESQVPEDDLYIERLVPGEIDRDDPDQLDVLLHIERQYRFAATFVENKHVLDIGCGVGFGAHILIDEGGASFVTGIDADKVCIDIALEEYPSNKIKYNLGSYKEIEGNGVYDSVVCLNMIEHVRKPIDVIKKARSAVKDGGELIISTYVTPTSDFNPTHPVDFTTGSFRRMVNRAGFRIEHELFRHKRFQPGSAISIAKERKTVDEQREKPRSLVRFYLIHPVKALRRIRSLILDGFVLKHMLIRAKAI
jgi:cyclopropane fatty-acyl-phospholipid synthase-like methyltransferase